MALLKQNNKNSLLYKFAFALCDTKPGTDEPVFPMDRMPFGLVEYQIEFFSCTHVKQVIVYMDCFFFNSFRGNQLQSALMTTIDWYRH